MNEPQTPDWVRDAIFYQIFPDRFARSLTVPKPGHLDEWGAKPTPHGYQGGDLIGVVERLDYLVDLGINALYFTPIFQSASNHRYHTHDYEKVDPMLGGTPALRRLLDEAHARGVRVVLDGVFNHASRGFFQFHDILENGSDSAYLDWFSIHSFPLNAYDTGRSLGYKAWWNLPALPKFNTETPAVREFLWGIGRKWIDFGIDGWRLDVPNEIDDDRFWREFRSRVRAGNPEAYIVGEVWSEAKRWLQGDMWDAVMNYLFTRACIAFFIGGAVDREELAKTSFRSLDPTGAPPAFRAAIERTLSYYHPNVNAVQMNLLDSHDMPRFLTLARGDQSALRLATLFQMTFPGAPSVYYGDEIGMSGGHDPLNRGAFPWDKTATWDTALLHDFQRLIALRKQWPALRRGSFEFLLAEDDVIAYARRLGDETVVVAINTGTASRQVDLPAAPLLADGTGLDEVWTHATVRVEAGMIRGVSLGPRSGRVFARGAGHERMSLDRIPPAWRLPEGVNASLWEYTQTPRLAEEEEEYFRGHPLFEADARALDARFTVPGPLVDLGCGIGRHALRFARRGFPVVAVELSQAMLAHVTVRARAGGVPGSLLGVRANLCNLGAFPDRSFDYALSLFSTLGMIRGRAARRKALAEAFRILRPGGRLALHAHNLFLNLRNPQGRIWLLQQAVKSVLRRPDAGDRRMVYRGIAGMEVHLYRWGELRRDLESAGFVIDEVLAIDTVSARPIVAPWFLPGVRAGGWIVFAHRAEQRA